MDEENTEKKPFKNTLPPGGSSEARGGQRQNCQGFTKPTLPARSSRPSQGEGEKGLKTVSKEPAKENRSAIAEEIAIDVRDEGGRWHYVLTDSRTGRSYQVGVDEARVIAGCPVAGDAFDSGERQAILRWAAGKGLIAGSDPPPAGGAARRFSAMSIRTPICQSEPIARAIDSWLPPVPGWALIVAAAALIIVSAWQWLQHGGRATDDWSNWMTPGAAGWILAAGVSLKVVHELAHAVAAVRCGITPGQFGVVWILLVPLPYVDVTAAWTLGSRWQRIAIAGAGMAVELTIAALAVPVLLHAPDAAIGQIAAAVIAAASVATVLFNANFLMRFDGYFMLCDAIGIANLAPRASADLAARTRWLFLGVPLPPPPPLTLGRRRFVTAYGVAAALWRVIVTVTLLTAAEALVSGLGAALMLVAAAAIAVRFAGRMAGVLRYTVHHPLAAVRATLVAAAVIAAGGLISSWPMPGRGLAGVVVADAAATVRLGADGFVESVLVGEGQVVGSGDPLMRLVNAELQSRRDRLAAQRRGAAARRRIALAGEAMPTAASEAAAVRSIDAQLKLLQTQIEQLTLVAPVSGRVHWHESPAGLVGRYVRRGDCPVVIDDVSRRHLAVMVPQHRRADWRRTREVWVHSPPHAWRARRSTSRPADPAATLRLVDRSLGVDGGGSLAVRVGRGDQPPTLAKPHFIATAPLPPGDPIAVGQRVRVVAGQHRVTIGGAVRRWLLQSLRSRVDRQGLLWRLIG